MLVTDLYRVIAKRPTKHLCGLTTLIESTKDGVEAAQGFIIKAYSLTS